MGKKKYLQITFGDGVIHEYSKTPKEDYELNENGKGYRKTYPKGLYGKLKGISLRDGNFGEEISVEMLDIHGDTNYLNIPLLDTQGGIGVFAESFIAYLPHLTMEADYRIFPYSMEITGSTYQRKGISIKYAKLPDEEVWEDEAYKIPRLSFSYLKKDGEFVQGDIPAVEWVQDFKGANKKNSAAKDQYLYTTLLNFSKNQTKRANQGAQPQAQTPPPAAPPAPAPMAQPQVHTPPAGHPMPPVQTPYPGQPPVPQPHTPAPPMQAPPVNYPPPAPHSAPQPGYPPQPAPGPPANVPMAPPQTQGYPPQSPPPGHTPPGYPGAPAPGGVDYGDGDDDLPF